VPSALSNTPKIRVIQAYFLECPGAIYDRTELGGDAQEIETRNRRTVGLGERKTCDFSRQCERIEWSALQSLRAAR